MPCLIVGFFKHRSGGTGKQTGGGFSSPDGVTPCQALAPCTPEVMELRRSSMVSPAVSDRPTVGPIDTAPNPLDIVRHHRLMNIDDEQWQPMVPLDGGASQAGCGVGALPRQRITFGRITGNVTQNTC